MTPLHLRPSLAQLLSRAERCVSRQLAAIIASHGGTLEQWRILTLLSDDAGHSMGEIAEYAFVPAPTLTRIVDRLIADNLAYRRIDDSDRRRVLLYPTAEGHALHTRVQADIDRYEATLAAPGSDIDVPGLAALLTRLVESHTQEP